MCLASTSDGREHGGLSMWSQRILHPNLRFAAVWRRVSITARLCALRKLEGAPTEICSGGAFRYTRVHPTIRPHRSYLDLRKRLLLLGLALLKQQEGSHSDSTCVVSALKAGYLICHQPGLTGPLPCLLTHCVARDVCRYFWRAQVFLN